MNEKRLDFVRSRRFPFGIADAVIIVLCAALAVVLALTVFGEKGNFVEITYGAEREVLPLNVNVERMIGDCLTVAIENGSCRVIESDCKNRICVKTGTITRVGESIVCAQNGVVITVIGDNGLAGTVGGG